MSAVSDDLSVLWAQVRDDLERARVRLPAGPSPQLDLYQCFLDHNELELACDELERCGMGVESELEPGFWMALHDACCKMGLTDHSLRFRARALNT